MPIPPKPPISERRASNGRLRLMLATIALAFFLGVIFKRILLGGSP